MRRTSYLILAAVLLALALTLPGVFHRQQRAPRPTRGPMRVMVTTSLLECAASEIGGRHVRVNVLIAPGSCPGHYDISPKDLKLLSESRLLLTHGYEGFVPKMMESAGSDRPRQIAIHSDGNWMIPSVYGTALKQVAQALSRSDPAHSKDYRRSLARLETKCKNLDVTLKQQLKAAGASKINVLCSDQQADVAKWMGLRVADTYPRAEQFTPVLLHYMTKVGRDRHADLCIDNLQSGPDAGKELAKDIGAAHVTLSNFPGGFAGTETWSKCIEDNVNRVIRGIGKK